MISASLKSFRFEGYIPEIDLRIGEVVNIELIESRVPLFTLNSIVPAYVVTNSSLRLTVTDQMLSQAIMSEIGLTHKAFTMQFNKYDLHGNLMDTINLTSCYVSSINYQNDVTDDSWNVILEIQYQVAIKEDNTKLQDWSKACIAFDKAMQVLEWE